MPAADWTAIENALYTWVQTASGLAAAQVIWAAQGDDLNRPAGQFVTLKMGNDRPLGAAPALSHTYDAGAANGQQIILKVDEVRELVVSVQVYGGPATTGTSARAIATKIQNALGLPTRRAALATAGLSPFDRGQILNVPEVLDADFEARAVFDVRFYVGDGAEERTTYVQSVEIEDTGTSSIFTVSS